ncbi:Uncharacterised protein at_DN2293 [Pycnogonum litorale]
MQPFVQLKWKSFALEQKRSRGAYPNFDEFVKFVAEISDEMNDPVYGKLTGKNIQFRERSKSNAVNLFTTKGDSSSNMPSKSKAMVKPNSPCVICKQNHRLWNCDDFKRKTPKCCIIIIIIMRYKVFSFACLIYQVVTRTFAFGDRKVVAC